MRKTRINRGNKQGYVLLLALVFTGLLALGSMLMMKVSSQKAFTATKRANYTQALMVAEAGAHRAFAMFRDDDSVANQPVPDISINGGISTITFSDAKTETVSFSSVGSSTKELVLRSTGKYAGEQAEVALLIRSSTGGSGNTTDPEIIQLFDGALFCGGDADMSGGGDIDLAGATAHVNGILTMTGSVAFENGGSVSSSTRIEMSGGNAKIWGDATAPIISLPSYAKWGPADQFIKGTQTETAVPPQMIEIDLEPFHQFAAATDTPGQDYSNKKWNDLITDTYISEDEMPKDGSLTINAHQIVRPSGGVLWVEGNIKLNGSSVIEGCIIATGNIDVLGGMTHKNPNGLPSFMSVTGDVLVGSGCQVYGLVYAHNGSIKIQGAAHVTGAFICPRGNFSDCGSGSVTYDNSRPYGPNGEIVMLPKGEAGSANGPPEIVGWIK